MFIINLWIIGGFLSYAPVAMKQCHLHKECLTFGSRGQWTVEVYYSSTHGEMAQWGKANPGDLAIDASIFLGKPKSSSSNLFSSLSLEENTTLSKLDMCRDLAYDSSQVSVDSEGLKGGVSGRFLNELGGGSDNGFDSVGLEVV